MVGGFVDGGSKFRVADLAAEDGGAKGEGGGSQGNDEHKPSATADPVGSPAEKEEAGDAPPPGDIEERGGFFGHLLLHLYGDVVRESFQAIFTPFSGY